VGPGSGDSPSFGAVLRRYRRAAGLTHEALAEAAGLSARTISDLERGVSAAPRRETLAIPAIFLCIYLCRISVYPSETATASLL